jgi:hypothetical protein
MKNPFHALKLRPKRPSASMVVAGLALFVGLGGGAYAATQINGNQIQDGTVGLKKLTPDTQGIVAHSVGAHWGVIDRNTIGSAVADLRAGPYGSFGVTGPSSKPPSGVGSLGIQVSDNATSGSPAAEKVAFGNEVDFLGNPVSGLSNVGFRVFQTGENAAISSRNMPNITLEINPHVVGAGSYTSMVWAPNAAPVTDRWTGYLNATTTGDWYFTGSAGTVTGCNQTTTCSFTAAKQALVDNNDGTPASIYTVAVAKGRDNTWDGAVDDLRINSKIYNFEPYGVREINAP